MCGIAGVYRFRSGRPAEAAEIRAMCDAVAYRGPDGQGLETDADFGMGHRRLSIIDVDQRSLQPMQSDDEQWMISYNGEVYNYLELKRELAAAGCRFHTTSDTEVVLAAFRRWGPTALQRFNGMYAFAVWHRATRTLTLVRDRLGVKPLYYAHTPDGIAFASEIKSLLRLPEVAAAANYRLLDGYMGVGYCPGEETFFDGICRLPPGQFLEVRGGSVLKRTYWDLEFTSEPDAGEAAYVNETQSLLTDAVRLQLRSDVPLGVFLSGGVDSSAVVAAMRRQGVSQIKTFAVNWDFGAEYDEGHYAREVAATFKTEHHECRVTPESFRSAIPRYVWHMDEPVQEAAGIALHAVAEMAKQEVDVALSGEGSDEVFGGYPVYRYMSWLERYRNVPQPIRCGLDALLARCGPKWRKLVTLSQLALERRYLGVALCEMSEVRELYSDRLRSETDGAGVEKLVESYYETTAGSNIQRRMQYLDVKSWLVDDLLIKADRMSMAASIELRVPFLDHRFLEFAGRLPVKYRLRSGEDKYLLKKAVEPYLPRHIVYRRKLGFPTPLAELFRGALKDYVRGVLLSERCCDRRLFEPDRISHLLEKHEHAEADHHKTIWRLLVLEVWHRLFVDGDTVEQLAYSEQELAA